MSALIDGNPDYQVITVMTVDWDTFGSAPIASELEIRRRSTLVSFKDGEEVGRVIAQTSAAAIEPLLAAAI